jgi:hypothetical protein
MLYSMRPMIETARVETPIDIDMTTRMHPPDAMMDFYDNQGPRPRVSSAWWNRYLVGALTEENESLEKLGKK